LSAVTQAKSFPSGEIAAVTTFPLVVNLVSLKFSNDTIGRFQPRNLYIPKTEIAIPTNTVATTINVPLESRLGERLVEVVVVEFITISSDLGARQRNQNSEIR